MKTTVEIADSLLKDARDIAAREGVTLRALIERGLRRVVAEAKGTKKKPFRLKDASFMGKGLHPDAEGASWAEIRRMIYDDRGG